MKSAVRLLVCGALLGCTPEFVEPPSSEAPLPEGGASPTTFFLAVQQVQRGVDSLSFNATLFPGADSLGVPVRVTNDTLVVEGVAHLPDPVHSAPPLEYVYLSSWASDPVSDTVSVKVPSVEGALDPLESVTLPLTNRLGPAVIEIPSGSDLLLPIATGRSAGGLYVTSERSFIVVSLPGSGGFSISRDGPMPSQWQIPGEWFAGTPGDTAYVDLISSLSLSNWDPAVNWPAGPAEAYIAVMRVMTFIRWTVIFE